MVTQAGGRIAAGAGTGLFPPRLFVALGRFIGTLALTFFGLIAVTFIIGRVMPIDPVLARVGDRALPATYEQVRLQMHLDQPILTQFWHYLVDTLQGDFGTSIITSHPALEDVLHFFPATFELATVAT